MFRSSRTALLCAAALSLFLACKENPAGPENFTVTLSALNLQQLPPSQGHYELWISFAENAANRALAKPNHGDKAFVSFGKFNLSPNNAQLVGLDGRAMAFAPAQKINIDLAVDALVTLEAEGDHDDEPASRLLGGEFTGSDESATAFLTTSAEDAFDYDYRNAAAAYVLTTPTTNDSADFKHGIWWITRGSTISAGLDKLLALADTSGWRYEGWVLDRQNGVAYSTGKFLSATSADSDLAGATAGADGPDQNNDGRGDGFAFPGQDFIRSQGSIPALLQLDNGNFEARITLEPDPDNASAPFYLALFTDDFIGPNLPLAHAPQTMNNRAAALPSATVNIKR
jgi:hypothetical protein